VQKCPSSVGDQGQRVEQGFEWPDDSALKRVEKEGGRISGDIQVWLSRGVRSLPEVILVGPPSALPALASDARFRPAKAGKTAA
jgi:hypothetical protein